jgi:hypothetical protein
VNEGQKSGPKEKKWKKFGRRWIEKVSSIIFHFTHSMLKLEAAYETSVPV